VLQALQEATKQVQDIADRRQVSSYKDKSAATAQQSVASNAAIQWRKQEPSQLFSAATHQISSSLMYFLQQHQFSLLHPISKMVTTPYSTTDLEKLRDKNMWSPLQKACHNATTCQMSDVGYWSIIIQELIEAASTDTLNAFIPDTPGKVAGWAPVHLLATATRGLPLLKLLVEQEADVTLEEKGVLQHST